MGEKKKKHKHRRSVLAALDASDEVVVSCKAPSTVNLGRSPPSEWNRKKRYLNPHSTESENAVISV